MTMTLIALDQLKFGHEAKPPINVRKEYRDTDIEGMAASLDPESHGQLQPLLVKEIGGQHFVAGGNRRLAGFRLLVKKGRIKADTPVECKITTAVNAAELSLVENTQRIALHPIDEFEAFQMLGTGKDPLTIEQIADRFGCTQHVVKQRLALGSLHPDIRAEWRAENINSDTAKAFTLTSDQDRQIEVFKTLKKRGALYGHYVRAALGSDHTAAQLVKFVGREAYEAAGGVITEDLFGDDTAVSHPEIAAKLAEAKRTDAKLKLAAEGWAWADFKEDLPHDARWSWAVDPKAFGKKTPTEVKARTGVILELQNGTLQFKYGVVKPDAKKDKSAAKTTKGAGSKGTGAPTISHSLNQRLSEQLTMAAQDALPSSPHAALAALVAALAKVEGSPICINTNGYDPEGRRYKGKTEPFGVVFARLYDMTPGDLLKAVGSAVAHAISMRRVSSPVPANTTKENASLLSAIDPAAMEKALKARFDAKDYFGSASAAMVLQAITEALGPDEANRVKTLKKPALAAHAVKNVPPTGWLPPELRTAHYKPPRELAKPAKAKAKPAKAAKLSKKKAA